MNRWYASGYISRDFTSLTAQQGQQLFDTRQIGVIWGGIAANFNRGRNLGFQVTSAPYPRRYLGQQLHLENTDIWPLRTNNTHTAISARTRYLEAAVRWLNYGYSDSGSELLNWGVEGVNWNWVNGRRTYNDLMLNHPQLGTHEASHVFKMHDTAKRGDLDVLVHASLLIAPDSHAIRMLHGDDPNVDSAFMLPAYQLTEAERALRVRIMSEISTYADEMVLRFITGAEPLANFNTFVTTINNMGLAQVLRSEQAAFERHNARTLRR
jgi:putative aldouronate transport system substrate-binding protein